MTRINIRSLRNWSSLFLLITLAGMVGAVSASEKKKEKDDDNIISTIVSAPVVTNGLVAGEPTEFNILLDAKKVTDSTAFDPDNFGHQIPSGGWMEIELSGTYMRNHLADGSPVPLFNNRSVILTTGPQNPIKANNTGGVDEGNWNLETDASNHNLIIIRPAGGHGKNGLEGTRASEIGFKVIHVRPDSKNRTDSGTPFYNGPAGTVGSIAVRIYKHSGKLVEQGYADVVFAASVGRQVHISNEGIRTRGAPPEVVELIDFQHVAAGTMLSNSTRPAGSSFSDGVPYAPRFIMFESLDTTGKSYIPQPGIANIGYSVDASRPWLATLEENGNPVGTIIMTGPIASSRGEIQASSTLTTVGGNGSFFNVPVKVGSEEGLYTVTVSFSSGGSATITIVVDDDD